MRAWPLACLLAILGAPGADAGDLTCPVLQISERFNQPPPPGWVPPPPGDIGNRNPTTRDADYAEFFAGNPPALMMLKPSASQFKDDGGSVIWQFSKSGLPIWLECRYGDIALVREVPHIATTCRAAYLPGDRLESIICRNPDH